MQKRYEEQIQSLLLDDACRVVARHLERAGLPFIALKGATIANWLYADPGQRTYRDLDILVAPDSEAAVVEALGQIGYRALLDPDSRESFTPAEQPLQNAAGVEIDLHVAVKGIDLAPGEAWRILYERSVPWDWAGVDVRALALPDRTLNLALHALQLGLDDEKALRDLELGLQLVDPPIWLETKVLAERLQATESLSAGLRLLPEGAELADRLGLAEPTSTRIRLQASSASLSAVTFERILTTPGWWRRVQLVRRLTFPSAAWMRASAPEATRTVWGLGLAWLRRPFHIAHRLPLALRERRRHIRGSPPRVRPHADERENPDGG